MPEAEQKLLGEVKGYKQASEQRRRPFIDRCNEYYGLYRNYRKLKAENDRDDRTMQEAKREWGAELFIPYCFATIETILPRILASNPKMKVKPKDAAALSSVDGIARLFEQRQAEIKYALQLQPVVRSGLKYGLGVGKTMWEREAKTVRRNEPRTLGYWKGMTTKERTVTKSEGPTFEFVDLFDFFWDPNARDIDTSEFAIHRTWRSTRYVKEMLESGRWGTKMALDTGRSTNPLLDMEAVAALGSASSARDQQYAERMKAAGLKEGTDSGEGKLHEVWEYHDRERVVTVLDGTFIVQNKPCYYHAELPFQIFRPTPQEGEFAGIGEIEPIAHLQYELNTLRSQRRDNATLILQKAFMYTEGRLVDPNDLTIAPGEGIAVYGNPRDVIAPLDFGELPNSSYSEEEALKRDIERTTGVSDSVAGGDSTGSVDTATGIQLVQSAANVRIAQKTANLEAELINPAAAQWIELYMEKTFGDRQMTIEDAREPNGYRFESIGPEQLAANVEIVADAGSTEPENKPQRRNDAMIVGNQMNGDPDIDQRKLKTWLLGEFGIPHPETWLSPLQPTLDPNVVGALLVQAGMDQDAALGLIQQALQSSAEDVQRPGDEGHPAEQVQDTPDQGSA